VFFRHYRPGKTKVYFRRDEIDEIADELGIERSKNPGHVVYHFRSRSGMPKEVAATAPAGMEWTIELDGRGKYAFVLVDIGANRIEPRWAQEVVKIPDATPEIVLKHAKRDEQAVLAKIRYNRLVDLFLGISAYSLQNHLRTSVVGRGQIEIDELYVGVDWSGRQYVVPVQAKRKKDRPVAVQAMQDIEYCEKSYPELVCRPIAVHTLGDGRLAMLELKRSGAKIVVSFEKHYSLVAASEISDAELSALQHSEPERRS
jgi:hypothetical protein